MPRKSPTKPTSPLRNSPHSPPPGDTSPPYSPRKSPTKPTSPDDLIRQIALLKHLIHNKDALGVIIDELQKKIETQRFEWNEYKKNRRYYDISRLKYGSSR